MSELFAHRQGRLRYGESLLRRWRSEESAADLASPRQMDYEDSGDEEEG